MSKLINKEIVLKLIDEVWNKGNLNAVDELVSPQYTIKNDPGDALEFKTLDLSVFMQRVSYTRNAFPDLPFIMFLAAKSRSLAGFRSPECADTARCMHRNKRKGVRSGHHLSRNTTYLF